MLSCSANMLRRASLFSCRTENTVTEATWAWLSSLRMTGEAGVPSMPVLGLRRAPLTSMQPNHAARILMTSSPTGCMTVQRRGQFTAPHGNREHESFLSQYDPMEVLGLSNDCTIEDIDKAFEQRKAYYGPRGAAPNAKMVDRVFRAHAILKDPNSPYYLRAHSSQTERQRLQFQLLPKAKRRLIEVQVAILVCIAAVACMLIIALSLRPMQRSLRAATR